MATALNVFEEPLEPCSLAPLTGYIRDGSCRTGPDDLGSHTVCAQMHQEFLEFSRSKGNDLITPILAFGFPGLKAGDRWCLCAARWKEALEAGCAPKVFLRSTHIKALEVVSLQELKTQAIDLY